MRTLIRSITIAAALLCVTALPLRAATATIADLGVNPNLSVPSPANSTGAPFAEDYLFQLTGPTTFSAVISNSFAGNPGAEITGLSLAVYSCTVCPVGPYPAPQASGVLVATLNFVLQTLPGVSHTANLFGSLGAGSYFLEVTGTGGTGASYGGNVSAIGGRADVPLPAAFPLFASGLGVLGMVMLRRRTRVTHRA